MGVLQLLAHDNFITYSKVIAREFGVNAAVLLGALCSYQNSFGNKEFYKEQEKITQDTCLSKYEISQALKILSAAGIVEIEKKGLPAKNFYKVIDNKLSKILTTCGEDFMQQGGEDFNDINNNTSNKKKNNNTLESKKESKEEKETYESVFDEFGVTGIYREAMFRWIAHLQATGLKFVLYERLKLIIVRLDMIYQDDDFAKVAAIDDAIKRGYKYLPCEVSD